MSNKETNTEVVKDATINPIGEFVCPVCEELSTFGCSRYVTKIGHGKLVYRNGEFKMEGWRYPYKLDEGYFEIMCRNCEAEIKSDKLEKLLNGKIINKIEDR